MEANQDLIKEILDIEWFMFERVRSQDPVSCQSLPDVFKKIRGSLLEVWSRESLESYRYDLSLALQEERNIFTEKYARMDNLIPPVNNNPLIKVIVEIETRWQEELRWKYPLLYRRMARTTSPTGDGSNFSIYLKCELETYSDRTISLYHANIKKAAEQGINLAISSLEILLKKQGFRDLDHAEGYLKETAPKGL